MSCLSSRNRITTIPQTGAASVSLQSLPSYSYSSEARNIRAGVAMTIAYNRRKKQIGLLKRFLDTNWIESKAFAFAQAKWQRKVDGPPIGTLEQLVESRNER